ncbi:MAG: hypothetical protein JXA98_06980 [Methanosarcinaceae archaeon]|nr:hypothetical protein [Methanosarcinaceae archaeon]
MRWPKGQFPLERYNPPPLSVEPECPAARVTLVRNDNVSRSAFAPILTLIWLMGIFKYRHEVGYC